MADNYVYIAECADGTYYTGWTTDPEARIAAHNDGRGAKYTRARLPVKLVYTAAFATKEDAMREEWRIKHLSRRKKEELINHA